MTQRTADRSARRDDMERLVARAFSDETPPKVRETAHRVAGRLSKDSPPGLSPGDRLGPYEIEETLGAGGQAMVYLARHVHLDRRVALKIPMRGVAERLLREARLLARLSHPRIVRVEHVEPEGPLPFLVLEHAEGGSLDELLARFPEGLPLPRVKEIATGILDALEAAHRAGIVHRDVKPQNVLFDGAGLAKVCDFGIGTAALHEGVEGSMVTAGTVFAGTPLYMAPEQEDSSLREGRGLDGRTDLYAFGKLLFTMLTGRGPRTFRPPSSFRPGLEGGWDELVLALTEERPRDRLPDAAAARDVLRGLSLEERDREGDKVREGERPSREAADEDGHERVGRTRRVVERTESAAGPWREGNARAHSVVRTLSGAGLAFLLFVFQVAGALTAVGSSLYQREQGSAVVGAVWFWVALGVLGVSLWGVWGRRPRPWLGLVWNVPAGMLFGATWVLSWGATGASDEFLIAAFGWPVAVLGGLGLLGATIVTLRAVWEDRLALPRRTRASSNGRSHGHHPRRPQQLERFLAGALLLIFGPLHLVGNRFTLGLGIDGNGWLNPAVEVFGWTRLLAASIILVLSVSAIWRGRRAVALVVGWNVCLPVALFSLLAVFRADNLLEDLGTFTVLASLVSLGLAGIVATGRTHWRTLRQGADA